MKTFYIIDGYLHIYRAYHAPIRTNLTSPSGEPTNGTYIFTTSLLKLIRKQKPDMLAIAMEGKGKTFRSTICDSYKANRSCPSDDFRTQRNRIEEILNAMNIPIFRCDGYEADDVIGTLAKKAQEDGFEVFICSNDKDMLQLVDEHIRIFNMKKEKRLDIYDMILDMGVKPSTFVDYLALQGDSADNIQGIPGVGAKTAAKWIAEYSSIENLIEHRVELSEKWRDKIEEFSDVITLGKALITIDCNVPIEIDYGKCAEKVVNSEKLKQVFTELGFNKLLSKLGLDN